MTIPSSAFPLLYWAALKSAETALVWHKAEEDDLSLPSQLSWQDLSCLAVKIAQGLPDNAQIIAYSGRHKFLGLLAYLSVLVAQKQILGLNPSLKAGQLEQILQDNQVDFLLTDSQVASLLEQGNLAFRLPHYDLSQPATLTLTSGSSGQPKAVVHSVQNHLDNAQGVCQLMDFTASNQWLLSLPLFHVSGQGIVWRWLLQGACLVLEEDKERLWQTLATVSHASLVPTQLQRYLQKKQENQPLAQHILLGGASIPNELIEAAQAQGIETYAGYGMTEMASTICASQNQLNHVGEPLAGREVCIRESEIWVRGAGLGLGYWLGGQIVPLTNQAGWLQTKDRGEWMPDGKLKVTGRLDNMFISGGENIQPEALEQSLFQSGLVETCFIVPLPDAEFGQRPVALVDFKEAFSPQAVQKLQNFASERLEGFKQPMAYLPLESEKWQQGGIKISRKQLTQYAKQILEKDED
ncbi:o-succinylbenzoate--CoA ligase [Pasteurellaceae bacterium RH1A]|nr:o-succinylbenzoate--CoA ligase [Pasteurellaceae bacterium RH1A]